MTSKSRLAQEKLQSLEKSAARFEDQLAEAAIFVGRTISEIRISCGDVNLFEAEKKHIVEKERQRREDRAEDRRFSNTIDAWGDGYEPWEAAALAGSYGASDYDRSDEERIRKKAREALNQTARKKLPLPGKVVYHGREEWLLRWLLKKLQAPKDDGPRQTATSWWLLAYLLRCIPLINVAQILVERKFVTILLLALQEAEKTDFDAATNSESSSAEQEASTKISKKRKRSGDLVGANFVQKPSLEGLMEAISAVVSFVVESAKTTSEPVGEGRSSAFIAEYMKTIIRTSAEDAAKILGSWLLLSEKALTDKKSKTKRDVKIDAKNEISPFIEIWECHVAEESRYLQFSLHATKPLLTLLRTPWHFCTGSTAQLEALVARNIIVPARIAFSGNAETDVFSSLTRISVIQDSDNAAVLFDIAIRCTQSPGARKRRRQQDDTWLASVFGTLKSSMPSRASGANAIAIRKMLQSAIKHKVSIDLAVLREIVWEYGLPEGSENWALIATVLELDGNVFLIPDEKEVLKVLLERITMTSLRDDWCFKYDTVVEPIIIPLMREFARARDLAGFIKHWFEQLVSFEKARKLHPADLEPSAAGSFSAWENEVLQKELKTLLEPSLTIPQISQILDWLQEQVLEHPDATCVILEAVSGAISGDEHIVDAIGLRMYQIMFDNGAAGGLDIRYRWRSWKIISRTLTWSESWDIDKLSLMWEQGHAPFDILSKKKRFKHLFDQKREFPLETFEVMRFVCAALEAADAEKEDRIGSLATNLLGKLLQAFAKEFKALVTTDAHEALSKEVEAESWKEVPKLAESTEVHRVWLYWSFVRCLMVDHPKALEAGFKIVDFDAEELLQNIFWAASAERSENPAAWLENCDLKYNDVWSSLLVLGSPVLQNKKLKGVMIDIMLKSSNNGTNPLVKLDEKNQYAIECLHMLRVDDFSKAQREQIMQLWQAPFSTVLDLQVLALKVKVMQHPAIYEGMEFKDLVKLADALSSAGELAAEDDLPEEYYWHEDNIEDHAKHLALLKEMTRLIFVAVLANADQARNKTYIVETLREIRTRIDNAPTEKLDFATIAIFGVALAAFHDKGTFLSTHNIIPQQQLHKVKTKFLESLLDLFSASAELDGMPELLIISIMEALTALNIDSERLELFVKANSGNLKNIENCLGTQSRLQTFLNIHGAVPALCLIRTNDMGGDVSSTRNRDFILERTRAAIGNKNAHEKLGLLQSMLATKGMQAESNDETSRTDGSDDMDIENDDESSLEDMDWSEDYSKLLAIRHIIASVEPEKGQRERPGSFGLSAVYTILAEYLPKVTEIRGFCLISETLELMLKTKRHSMSQYNIDCTIGAITILCSAKAPALKSIHAGTIYTHLCRLLQTILMHHRLKLQGHTHLTQQAMQSLLRCLFIPTSPSHSVVLNDMKPKFASLPPWLAPLTLTHAQHFTKLLLLIADPPLSTLSQGRTNPLVSLKDKAKRMSAQWTKYILQEYIWLQLDMNVRMDSAVREALMQGWFAVLETMNESGRDAMRGEMDSGGRAVFRGLFEEWRRIGGKRE